MSKLGGRNGDIADPVVLRLGEMLELCSMEMEAWFGLGAGCSQCPMQKECVAVWSKEVVERYDHNLRAAELLKIGAKLKAVKEQRNVILGGRRLPAHKPAEQPLAKANKGHGNAPY